MLLSALIISVPVHAYEDASGNRPPQPLRERIEERRREDASTTPRHMLLDRARALGLMEGCGRHLGQFRERIAGFASLSESEKEAKREYLGELKSRFEEVKALLETGTSSTTDGVLFERAKMRAEECRHAIIENAGSFGADRIVAITSQMKSFVTKLHARVDALEVDGIDVSAYEATLSEIQNDIAEAEVLGSEIQSLVTGSDVDAVLIKEKMSESHATLKAIREALRAFVESIKSASST